MKLVDTLAFSDFSRCHGLNFNKKKLLKTFQFIVQALLNWEKFILNIIVLIIWDYFFIIPIMGLK
jgi:hypothetical protein